MTGLNLGMVIEIVVALLLVLTIAYCIVLNRRLTRLRADEEVLRATIAELITATEIAERAILGLKATAADCDKSLGSRLSTADSTLAELDRRIALGDDILRRLVAATRAGEAAAEAPVRHAPEPALRDPAHRDPAYREQAYREMPRAEPGYREAAPEPAYGAHASRPAPTPGYGFAMAPASAQPYPPSASYGYPAAPAAYEPRPEPVRASAPAPAAREPVARSLQAAAEAAAERLSAYRRAQREEAA